MLGQRPGVSLGTELVEQVRRALDVGEDESDGATRQLGPHAEIIRRSPLAGKRLPQGTFLHDRADETAVACCENLLRERSEA